jgi:hypothetical protein
MGEDGWGRVVMEMCVERVSEKERKRASDKR